MAETHFFVIDSETVRDPRVAAPVREDGSEGFPSPVGWEVVAISFVAGTITGRPGQERYELRHAGSVGDPQADEPELLSRFWRFFGKSKPELKTWGGRRFDMPMLKVRSLVNGVPFPAWYRSAVNRYENYDHRYAARWHDDLMDILSDHGAAPPMKLDDVARAVGLPGKIESHGSEVADLITAGDRETVRRYCDGDCMNLTGIFYRWAYVTGATDAEGYRLAVRDFAEHLQENREAKPHFGSFLDAWPEGRSALADEFAPLPPKEWPSAR